MAPVPFSNHVFGHTAVAVAGLPPLSGFVGKLLILDGVQPHPAWPWIWGVVLVTTLVGVLALARAGSVIFWKHDAAAEPRPQPDPGSLAALPAAGLILALVALTALAGPATNYATATAGQLTDRSAYIGAVLGTGDNTE